MKNTKIILALVVVFIFSSCETTKKNQVEKNDNSDRVVLISNTNSRDLYFEGRYYDIINDTTIKENDLFRLLSLVETGNFTSQEIESYLYQLDNLGDLDFFIFEDHYSKQEGYFLYRLSEMYNCTKHTEGLYVVLLTSFNEMSPPCLYKVEEFLSYVEADNNMEYQVSYIDSLIKEKPNWQRLKYIKAKYYKQRKEYDSYVKLMNELIDDEYLKRSNLQELLKFFTLENYQPDSIEKYVEKFRTNYSGKCDINVCQYYLNSGGYKDLVQCCEYCLTEEIPCSIDSIVAQTFLAEMYLKEKKYDKLSNLHNLFLENNKTFIPTTDKRWEYERYTTMKLGMLLGKGEYNEYLEYLLDGGEYFGKQYMNKDEVFVATQNIYQFAISDDLTGFDNYYKQNIEPLIE